MRMTVGKKIAVAFAALVGLSIAVGVVALVNVARMSRLQTTTVMDVLPGIYRVSRLEAHVADIRKQMLMHIASKDQHLKAGFESNILRLRNELKASIHEYEKTIGRPADREIFLKVEPALDRFFTTWEPIRVVSRRGRTDKAFGMFQATSLPALEEVVKVIADELNRNKKYGDECTTNSNAAAASARLWIWVMLSFAVVLAAGLAYVLVRRINLTLHRSVSELADGTAQISNASSQVALSSQSLAQGASEQAASLEETSASAEEITSMTCKNAENSRAAAELMSTVDRHVKQSNRTLEQMVVSMHEINASSDKISRIIKVIDEIAFQTNILALNAAIEAARAGEAGMGFAVVADEVRNLAQRSAQAAKDTAGLIEESIAKSNEGSTKLKEVAEVIRAITDSAAKVKTLVDEVNFGSQEQARGIDEISKAINEMSRVTQSTASSADRCASASEETASQAQAMSAVVARLRGMVVTSETERPAPMLKSAVARKPVRIAMPPGKGTLLLEDEFTEI